MNTLNPIQKAIPEAIPAAAKHPEALPDFAETERTSKRSWPGLKRPKINIK